MAIVSLLIHRWLFLRLSRYPGPWLNSFSEFPVAIALAYGRQQAYYSRLHRKYGPIVRGAPNELSFADPKAWNDIYNRASIIHTRMPQIKQKPPHMEKSPVFVGAVAKVQGAVGVTMASLASKDHGRQRRALGYSFTTQAILQQEDIILLHVRKMLALLKRSAMADEKVNMSDWYTYTTFDIIGDLAFGEPFGCLDQRGQTDWSRAVSQVFASGAWEQAIRRVTGVDNWAERTLKKLLVPRALAKWRRLHLTRSMETAQKRIEGGEREHKDVMYFVLKNQEARQSLSDMEPLLNMGLVVSAGSETTAGTLTAWTYFVSSNPRVHQLVANEIRGKFKRGEDIDWQTVNSQNLPYLHATIEETLRLLPLPAASPQRIVPQGGVEICGEYVPEGCCVAVSRGAMTRNQQNFTKPNEFRPERWLEHDDPDWDDTFANDKLEASQPYAIGPTTCLGKNLANFNLRLILANMMRHFDIDLAGP
ncbi:cytochrome P450 [Diaporthe sp. PMI_573]|nr:cytochrome P450 [Diaporthaceae sp. PMI_573]